MTEMMHLTDEQLREMNAIMRGMTTLEEGWDAVLAGPATIFEEEDHAQLKKFYFAGAATVMTLLNRAARELDTMPVSQRATAINREIEEFFGALRSNLSEDGEAEYQRVKSAIDDRKLDS